MYIYLYILQIAKSIYRDCPHRMEGYIFSQFTQDQIFELYKRYELKIHVSIDSC